MALHFPLMVNGARIGKFVAQRREPVIPADRICTYDVQVELHGSSRSSVVRHNYDHGAFELVRAGLTEALTGPEPVDLDQHIVGRGKVRTVYRVPPAMPVFPILAKDALAVGIVATYRDMCLAQGLTAQAEQVQLALDEVVAWQATNVDQVKPPDHQHRPAGSGDDG